jgi:hypothetical protein
MKIKKILAGGLAAVAAGATIAFGAFAQSTSLGDFVTVSGNALSSPWIVVGTPATPANAGYAKDVVGAADIAAAVAGYATTNVAVGGATSISVSGGADLSTANTKLYLGDAINTAKQTVTKADLPTTLASGVFSDDTGTNYNYDQYIVVGSRTVTFGNSGSDIEDPTLYINAGTAYGSPIYTTRVVFTKPLNVSSSDVQGNVITMFGNEYTIGSGSTTSALILYGSSNAQTISEGESVTINVGGTDHTVSVIGVSATTIAVISVDGVSKEVHQGSSYTISGVTVYIDSVFFFTKETQVSQVKLSVGSSKITLTSGSAVEIGESGDTIENTMVTIAGGTNTGISKLDIAVAAQDSDYDHVSEDLSYTDPLFGGFKFAFGGSVPALDDAARDQITVDTSGDDVATVAFTDWRGYSKTIEFAYDSDTGATTFTPILSDSDGYAYHVVEGELAAEKDYVIVKQGDFSHIFQINDIASIATSNAKVVLKDVVSSESITVNMEAPGNTNATAYIDGYAYYINATSTAVQITWGTDSSATAVGASTDVFPTYGLVRGEGLVLGNQTAAQALVNNKNWTLPTGMVTVTYPATNANATFTDASDATNTVVVSNDTGSQMGSITLGRIAYNITRSGNNVQFNINSLGTYSWVVLLEELGKNIAGAEVNDAVYVPLTYEGTSTYKMAVNTPTLTADTKVNGVTRKSDTSITDYLDRYGTLVSYNTDDQNQADIFYPDNQAIMGVAVGAAPVFGTSGSTGTVEQAVKITSPVAKLDSEVSTTGLSADLILLGGPCANDLVATLMSLPNTEPGCYEQWTYTTGIIKEYTDAFGSGQKALVVAGTTADDTRSLAAQVMSGTLSYEA